MRRLVRALDPRAIARQAEEVERLEQEPAIARGELAATHREIAELARRVDAAEQRLQQALAGVSARARERADMAAPGGPRLLSDSIVIEGAPSRRARMRRMTTGPTVRTPTTRLFGSTAVESHAADVRDLWAQLEAAEAACTDDVLRGDPSTVLDVGSAEVWRTSESDDRSTLHVALRDLPPQPGRGGAAYPTVAIPRCTFHAAPRKLRNFGHWMLDYLPHLAALRTVAPEATYLVPEGLAGFHRRTMAMVGIDESRTVAWDGSRLSASRVLILEGDGRLGGGRPLSSLLQLRETLSPAGARAQKAGRRIYVSRRDAKPHRRWVDNEPALEALFASKGFEVHCMAGWALEEQRRVFSGACVVAGVSGAGLTDLVFTPAGAHVIVLVSDNLMRWYADDGQSRAQWLERARQEGELSALGDSPRFYAHIAALCGQTSHVFVGEDEMPLDPLSAFVDRVLAQVEREGHA